MSIKFIPLTEDAPRALPQPTPGQLLSAKERAAQAFRERLGREGVSLGGSRTADHVSGFKYGWDAAVAFLQQTGLGNER